MAALALIVVLLFPTILSAQTVTGTLQGTVKDSTGGVLPGASVSSRNVETGQPTQIITSLPEMLTGFDRIHELAGKEKLIVAGHDPLVADRFKQVGPGIIKIA